MNEFNKNLIAVRKVDVKILTPESKIVFQKDQFEVPKNWSDKAATIAASKYAMDSENSVIDIINRIVNTITDWGITQGYFGFGDDTGSTDEDILFKASKFSTDLWNILIDQRAAFNSPVWFNIGSNTGTSQASACFVLPVEDTMESILDYYKTEGLIFKGGSGAGVNVSKLRAKGERLSNKGSSSGPLSFMKGWDSNAGTIKSAGKQRRAAKLVCMNADHPDIMEFIECKWHEENKAKILIDNGISPEEAYATVAYQNTNHSIRVTNNFMRLSLGDNNEWPLYARSGDKSPIKFVKAKDILHRTAEIAWETGDPGIQFHDKMNENNPVPSLGEIETTNPCSEFSAVNNSSCNLASMNLVKYYNIVTGIFDFLKFSNDIHTMITAMDILVDGADYPTETIAKTTKATRPLGLGFSNLGALLMIKGLPYDSIEARNIASTITHEMTYSAYRQSINLAQQLGPFDAFNDNKNKCINICTNLINNPDLTDRIKKYGLRNSQLTLLAPCGCLKENSLILTSNGIIPINSLWNNNLINKWQNINTNIIQENQITNATKSFSNGIADTIHIVTNDGYEIEGTLNHKLRILDNSGNYIWKRLDEITINDNLVMKFGGHEEILGNKEYVKLDNKQYNTSYKTTPCILPEYLTEELAWIIGLYMSDGCLHIIKDRVSGIRFFSHINDKEVHNKLINYCQKVFGVKPKATMENKNSLCLIHEIHSVNIGNFFINNNFKKNRGNKGEGAASSHIPKQILQSRTSVLCKFIRGYFDGDGCLHNTSSNNHNSNVEIVTVSKRLATELQIALLYLGIRTKVTGNIYKGCYGNRKKYRIRVRSKYDLITYRDKIGFTLSKHKKMVNHIDIKERTGIEINCPTLWEELFLYRDKIFYKDGCSLSTCARTGHGTFAFAKYLIDKYNFLNNTKMSWFITRNLFTQKIDNILHSSSNTYDISVPENNTYIANGFISHNTIGLLMDCDSTGIEPLFTRQGYKQLSGGGRLEITPNCVEIAKGLYPNKPEVLKTANEIHWKDHIAMMAACQAHLSSAISKTINMPSNATVEDIEEAYILAWRLGLKAIAVYRDGSKFMQPLKETKSEEVKPETKQEENKWNAVRRKLSKTRDSITHAFDIGGFEGYITVGLYEDGEPGEIFINMQKQGSSINGLMDSFAVLLSHALQYGVPLEKLVYKFKGTRFEPAGFTDNEDIRMTTSIMDYIFRWLSLEFLEDKVEKEPKHLLEEITTEEIKIKSIDASGPPCQECGQPTVLSGRCYFCTSCGLTLGCS
jgi:ribonucleoside-diphosphate reductase alpha chain